MSLARIYNEATGIANTEQFQPPPIATLGIPGLSKIPDSDLGSISDLVTLPSDSYTVNADTIVKQTETAARAEGTASLLQRLSREQLRTLNAQLNMVQTRATHNEAVMKVENRYQQLQAKYGKAVIQHGLEEKVQAAEIRGFAMAFRQAHNNLFG